MSESELSLLISGAGPVGLALALALRTAPVQITIVEQKDIGGQLSSDTDARMVALSESSCRFLASLDVWSPNFFHATPINRVHVSQKNTNTAVLIDAAVCGVDHLGFLVSQADLISALYHQLEAQPNVTILTEAKVTAMHWDYAGRPEVTIKSRNALKTQLFDLVVSAEGTDSVLRQSAGIKTCYRDYDQAAVIATGRFEKKHQNTAYERFTESGPLALLPMNDHEMALILIVPRSRKSYWEHASDLAFETEIIMRFGAELGMLTDLSARQVWPLQLLMAQSCVKNSVVLIGNSAHALHPIAGQGLNLGLRDSKALADLLYLGVLPDAEQWRTFANVRKKDAIKTAGSTDFLLRAFGLSCAPAHYLRSFALTGLEHFPFLKKKIARIGMGY